MKTGEQAGVKPRGTVQFPIDEPFTGATTQHSWSVFKKPDSDPDTAKLTGDWLQLTAPKTQTAGAYVMNDNFSTDKGVMVDFDYNVSEPGVGGGADGFALMLLDGSVTPSRTGATGSGLGYACLTRSGGACQASNPGIEGGWLGVGFDTFGGWSSASVGNGGPGGSSNSIGLRGSGNGATTGYGWLAGPTTVPGNMTTGDANSSRHARVLVQGTTVTVWIEDPGTGELTEIIAPTDVSSAAGQAPLPATFKLGFAGSTGDNVEAHKIKNLGVTLPVKTQIEKTGTATAGGGDKVSYTVTATQFPDSPNRVDGAEIKDTVPAAITDVAWTCTATNGGSCATASGTGNDISTKVDLPINSKATLTVTGTASKAAHPATNTATLTLPTENANLDPDLPLSASQATAITADDFDVTASAAGGPVPPGGATTIPVKVKNNGGDDAQADPVVTVKVPAGTTPAGSQPAGCAASGDTVTCTVPKASLTNGASVDLPISITVDAGASGSTTLTQAGGITVKGTLDTVSSNDTTASAVQVSARSADLKIEKNVDPADPDYGGDATYTIKVTNQGPSDTTGVKVTDKLPTGATWKSDDSSGAYDPPTGVWTVGGLTAGSSKTLTVTVTMTSNSAITNAVTEATSDATDPTPCDTGHPGNCASATSTATGADLVLTKTVDDATPDYGANVTFTVTVSNSGPKAATAVSVTDKLPPGLTYVSDNGAGSYAPSSGLWTVGNLAVSGERSLTITAKVDTDATTVNSVTEAQGTPGDPTPCDSGHTGNCPSATVTPVAADISTTKVATTSTPIRPGDTYDYKITVSNAGPSTATGVKVTDTLPSELEFVSSPEGCTATGQAVTCPEAATVAKDASASWTLKVRLSADYTGDGKDIHNRATGTTDQPDPDPSNNTSAADSGGPPGGTVEGASADVSVTKAASADQAVHPGDEFQYTVTVTNHGPSTAVQAAVTDTLPTQVSFEESGDGCTVSGQTVSCPPGNLSAQSGSNTRTYTYTVRLDPSYSGDGTDVQNKATVTAQTSDPDTSNNTATADLSSLPGGGPAPASADLALTKDTAQTTKPPAGSTFPYTLEVTNNGPSDAKDVTVTDELPGELSFVRGEGCSAAGLTVTCGPEAVLEGGKGKEYTITVKLAASASGDGADITNTATVSSSTADPDPDNNSASKGLPGGGINTPSADLALTKDTAQTTKPSAGSTFPYTLEVTNNGPSDAKDVTVTDELPSELSFVRGEGCSAAGLTVTCGPEAVLEGGKGKEYTITVKLAASASGDGADITNTATVSSSTADPDPDNNSASKGLPGGGINTASADVRIDKATNSREPIRPGETFVYRLTVDNDGPSDAANVTTTDPLPESLSFVSSTSDCTASGRTVTCPRQARLAADAETTFAFMVRLAPDYDGNGSDITNTAITKPDTADPKTTNNTATLDMAVPGGSVSRPEADLETVKKVTGSEGVRPGGTFRYTITITNHGPSTARTVTVTDPLPVGLTFASSSDGCTASGQTVTCPPVAAVQPGASVSRTFTVMLNRTYQGDGSDLANVASVNSGTHDPNSGNNQNNGSEAIPQGLLPSPDNPSLPDTGQDRSTEVWLAALAASLLIAGGVLIATARSRKR